MNETYEFLSNKWIEALEIKAQKLLDASDGITVKPFTYVEYFTNAPTTRSDGKKAGYAMTISDKKVSINAGVQGDESADCLVVMDYSTAMESMKLQSGPELSELSRQAAMSGNLTMTGSLEGIPIPMNTLHDQLCQCTKIPT